MREAYRAASSSRSSGDAFVIVRCFSARDFDDRGAPIAGGAALAPSTHVVVSDVTALRGDGP